MNDLTQKKKAPKKRKRKYDKLGQPPKYKKEYCAELINYFASRERTREVEVKTIDRNGIEHVSHKVEPIGPPTIMGFAIELGVARSTLYLWADEYKEFSVAMEMAKDIQGEHIVQNSMEGKSPTAFSIFMMKNNHGWTDRIEQKTEVTAKLEDIIGGSFAEDNKPKE